MSWRTGYEKYEDEIRRIGNVLIREHKIDIKRYRTLRDRKAHVQIKVLDEKWYKLHGRHITFRMSRGITGPSDYHKFLDGNYPPLGLFGYKRKDCIVHVMFVDMETFRLSVKDDLTKRRALHICNAGSNNPFVSLRIPSNAVIFEKDLTGEREVA